MWNNKKTQIFEDGEFTSYYFANNNRIDILTKKHLAGYKCDIGWSFNNLIKSFKFKIEDDPLKETDKKITIQLKELFLLYNNLKKHKNKTTEKQLLISALMIVIHDIKEQQYKQLNLF